MNDGEDAGYHRGRDRTEETVASSGKPQQIMVVEAVVIARAWDSHDARATKQWVVGTDRQVAGGAQQRYLRARHGHEQGQGVGRQGQPGVTRKAGLLRAAMVQASRSRAAAAGTAVGRGQEAEGGDGDAGDDGAAMASAVETGVSRR